MNGAALVMGVVVTQESGEEFDVDVSLRRARALSFMLIAFVLGMSGHRILSFCNLAVQKLYLKTN